jgi:hypothetical protein
MTRKSKFLNMVLKTNTIAFTICLMFGKLAFAASTAALVVPGYLTNTLQPNCTTTPCFVQNGASGVATSGWTPLIANAQSTTVKAVKSSAGQLGMLQCYNPNASQVYVQIFNVASGSVVLGTTAPTLSIPIAPTSTGGYALSNPGISLGGSGVSLAVTTTATGNTAPATAADCNVAYN